MPVTMERPERVRWIVASGRGLAVEDSFLVLCGGVAALRAEIGAQGT